MLEIPTTKIEFFVVIIKFNLSLPKLLSCLKVFKLVFYMFLTSFYWFTNDLKIVMIKN